MLPSNIQHTPETTPTIRKKKQPTEHNKETPPSKDNGEARSEQVVSLEKPFIKHPENLLYDGKLGTFLNCFLDVACPCFRGDSRMLWMRKVTNEDVRSTYIWCSKDPPIPLTSFDAV